MTTTPTVGHIGSFLDSIAPLKLAEDWDNVGLLIGHRDQPVRRILTCLTTTPEVVKEARDTSCELVLSHHPLPFKPLKRVTSDSYYGSMVLDLIRSGISLYSAHTAYDGATHGINQQIAAGLGLANICSLRPQDSGQTASVGRQGVLPKPMSIQDFAHHAKRYFEGSSVRLATGNDLPVRRVGIACGAVSSLLNDAVKSECDTLVTGEASFHTILEAKGNGINLVLCGHFHSERFAMGSLAEALNQQFSGVHATLSIQETDPLISID